LRRVYRWNGEYFAFTNQLATIAPNPNRLADCETIIDFASTVWGPGVAIPLMQTLLPDWPPAQDTDGKPYPPDARDEWLYRLGVYTPWPATNPGGGIS
jgi:hypothetical protein